MPKAGLRLCFPKCTFVWGSLPWGTLSDTRCVRPAPLHSWLLWVLHPERPSLPGLGLILSPCAFLSPAISGAADSDTCALYVCHLSPGKGQDHIHDFTTTVSARAQTFDPEPGWVADP